MKTIRIALLAAALTVIGGVPGLTQSGQDLLQQALVKEQADGDLRAAIAIYQRIVRDFAGDRVLAAKALMQLVGATRSSAMPKRGRPARRTSASCASSATRPRWRRRPRPPGGARGFTSNIQTGTGRAPDLVMGRRSLGIAQLGRAVDGHHRLVYRQHRNP